MSVSDYSSCVRVVGRTVLFTVANSTGSRAFLELKLHFYSNIKVVKVINIKVIKVVTIKQNRNTSLRNPLSPE